MIEKYIHRIGVDWGSTSFRAYLFDQNIKLVDSRSSNNGIKSVISNEFEQCLFDLIGDWLSEDSIVLFSGMITSRSGWIETPYLELPTKLDRLLAQSVKRRIRKVNMCFLPGLSQTQPRADVIRGEELQLVGASQHSDHVMVIMPGTHSKWAHISAGTVTAFQTIVTGELFDVLLKQTLVGQLASSKALHTPTFTQAVVRGYESSTIISELFHARSGVLLNELAADHVHSYVSGLLIGNEIREGLSLQQTNSVAAINTMLIGSDELCNRYELAFKALNLQCTKSASQTTSAAFAALLATYKP